jgi:hypothetical protein
VTVLAIFPDDTTRYLPVERVPCVGEYIELVKEKERVGFYRVVEVSHRFHVFSIPPKGGMPAIGQEVHRASVLLEEVEAA